MSLMPLGASDTPGNTNPDGLGPLAAGAPPAPTSVDMEHPLRPLVGVWMEKIRIADLYKKSRFSDDAAEAMQFFSGPYDFMYSRKYGSQPGGFACGSDDDEIAEPSFKMTVNKVAEAVQIFGPVLYHRNPNRKVTPREVPIVPPEYFGNMMDINVQMLIQQAQAQQQSQTAMDKLRAVLLSFYLNYTPTELDLKTHSRRAIDESIIKGMGCLWTEVYTPKGQPVRQDGTRLQLVGSFFESVDHLMIDPDGETLENAKWIARRCIHPAWEVEQQYGLPAGTLRGVAESAARSSELNSSVDGDHERAAGGSADLVAYWKIYSKMGVGGRLQGIGQAQRDILDRFGDYCYLVICEGIPYPLNLPPSVINSTDPNAPMEILGRLDWPTPFWASDDWPMTPIYYHEVPRCPWPMSHFKPAMGELKFLNWIYSFIAGKIKNTCRDFLAVAKGLDDEIKEAILHGGDLTLIELAKQHGDIAEVVQFLQHPQMNGDIWQVIEAVTANFEKRTGLTELVYGESASSYRSAEEAQLKGSQLQIRPDDMAQKVEDAMTLIARKEALAARWHLKGQDVAPSMGSVCAHFWDQAVVTQDFFEGSRQLDYRIEAGSSKKPNKQRDADNMKQAMQSLFQPLFDYASSTGNVNPVNALITDWAKSIDLKPEAYLLAAPPPPPPPTGGPAGPHGEPPGGGAANGPPPHGSPKGPPNGPSGQHPNAPPPQGK
jgi:hypothetical protein